MRPQSNPPRQELLRRIDDLTIKLQEAEDTLQAIREGEVDAIMVKGSHGEHIFSLMTSDIAYRFIVETMSEAAITTTLDGRVLYCNTQFGRLLGVPMEELVGRQLAELVVAQSAEAITTLIRESGSQPSKRRVVFAGSMGPVPSFVSASPLEQPDGPAVCLVAADLTELEASTELVHKLSFQQEMLRKNTEKFELLSETASQLLKTSTPQGTINTLCRRVMEILGCDVFLNYLVDGTRDRLLLNASAGVPEEAARALESLEMSQAISEVFSGDQRFVARDIQAGRDPQTDVVRYLGIDTCIYLPLVSQGKLLGSICFGARNRADFSSDEVELAGMVTDQVAIALERVRMEEALARANEALEARVTKRTEELLQANTELKRSTRMLRILSGELAVTEQRERRRFSGMLHDNLQQLLVDARREIEAGRLSGGDEVGRALDRVNELLGQSIEATHSLTVELSPPVLPTLGLGPLLQWLAQWMAEKHNLAVELSVPAQFPRMGEEMTIQLFQAVRELLLNVVKHSGVGRATLDVTVTDGVLKLSVSDKGVGFYPAVLREKSKSESAGLFGIRERLGLIDGALAIESKPGGGSRLTLSVLIPPADEAPAEDAPIAEMDSSPASHPRVDATGPRIRVLLVDGHEYTRRGLSQLLAGNGDMEVVAEAADVRKAVGLAELLRPDVIVMDMNMPDMNGIEATRLIVSRNSSVKVVALSVFHDQGIAAAMRDAGAARYVNKSESPQLLVEAVRSCARSSR